MCWNRFKCFLGKQEITKRRTRQFAIVIFVIYLIIAGYFVPSILRDYEVITNSQEIRTFKFPVHIALNETSNDADISFVFNFTCKKNLLAVNELIDINGTGVLHTKMTDNIKNIKMWFQNCLLYNETENQLIVDGWGIPENGYLDFDVEKSGIFLPYIWSDTITVIWQIEGNYNPVMQITYNDGTKSPQITLESVVIPVYPKEQLTQIQTNNVNTKLSLAVFLFSFCSVLGICIDLWFAESKHIISLVQGVTEKSPETQEQTLNNTLENQEKHDLKTSESQPQEESTETQP